MIPRQRLRKRRLFVAAAGLALVLVSVALGWWLVALVLVCAVMVFASRRIGVPIMVYHSVSPDASWLPWADNIAVRPQVFEAHMRHLARSGWRVISSQQLIAGQSAVKSVVLHFDDAYVDFQTIARPILERYQLPSTVFASSDFIDPSTGLRTAKDAGGLRGYMNGDELRDADASPLIEVACHGKDHARVAVGGGGVPRDPSVWGKETAWLWSLMPGNKARWFDQAPPSVKDVPQNDSSLCACRWTSTGKENAAVRDARVQADLAMARNDLGSVLGRDITFLCWPFDRCNKAALANAKVAGFSTTTGGVADNRADGSDEPLSRTHVNDYAAAGGPLCVEVLVFRAKLEVASGNLLFWPVTMIANLLRKRRFKFLHGPQSGPQQIRETS